MPAPDFDQIARTLTDQANAITPLTKGMIYYAIKDALRQVWNARGAADRQALDDELLRVQALIDTETPGDLEINVDRVMGALDRR